MSKNGIAVFEYSNQILIWWFFAAYTSSLITFCFLFSLIFKNRNNIIIINHLDSNLRIILANTATNVGTLIYIVTCLPFEYFSDDFYRFAYPLKFVICMLTNSGLGSIICLLLKLESDEIGLTFSNVFTRTKDLEFSYGEMMLAMIAGIIVHLLLIFYVEKVFPGDIGIPEKWYFPIYPFIKYFKKQLIETNAFELSFEIETERIMLSDSFEREPQDKKI